MKKYRLPVFMLILILFASLGFSLTKNYQYYSELMVDNVTIENQEIVLKNIISENVSLNATIEEKDRIIAERIIEYDSLTQLYNIAVFENKEMKERLFCEESISWDVDYSSNETVSQSLIKWVEELYKISYNTYEAIWNDSLTTVHILNSVSYKFYYIVYFDEPNNEYSKGIFSAGMQCWID